MCDGTQVLIKTMERPRLPLGRRPPPVDPLPQRPGSDPLPAQSIPVPSEPPPARQPLLPTPGCNPPSEPLPLRPLLVSERHSDPLPATLGRGFETPPPLPPRPRANSRSPQPDRLGANSRSQQPDRLGANSRSPHLPRTSVVKPLDAIAAEQKKRDDEREVMRTKPLPRLPQPKRPMPSPRLVGNYENVPPDENVEPRRPKLQRPPKPKGRKSILRSSSMENLDRRSFDAREVSGYDLDTIIDLQMKLLKVSEPDIGGVRESGLQFDWSRRSSIKGWKTNSKNLGGYLKNCIAVQHIREQSDHTPESVPQVCETIQDLLDKKIMEKHIIPGVEPEVQSYIGMFLLNEDKWTTFADDIGLSKEEHELIRHVAREYHYLPFAICLAHWRRVEGEASVTKSALIEKLRAMNAEVCLINRLCGA